MKEPVSALGKSDWEFYANRLEEINLYHKQKEPSTIEKINAIAGKQSPWIKEARARQGQLEPEEDFNPIGEHTHIPIAGGKGHITWHGDESPSEKQMKAFENLAECVMKVTDWDDILGENVVLNPPPPKQVSEIAFEQCLREEFLINTENYPKEYHKLFSEKFNRAAKRFKESLTPEPKEPIMSRWISVEDRFPNAHETSVWWDGRKSDSVIVELVNGKHEVAHLYSGFMDGSEFNDWYDNGGFELDDKVVKWMPLAPEQEEGG